MNTRACKLEAEDKDRLKLRKLANSLISDGSSEGVSAFSFEEGFGLDFFPDRNSTTSREKKSKVSDRGMGLGRSTVKRGAHGFKLSALLTVNTTDAGCTAHCETSFATQSHDSASILGHLLFLFWRCILAIQLPKLHRCQELSF